MIYAPSTLRRAAWMALLREQPGIEVVTALATPTEVETFLAPPAPTTLLVDVPMPQPELARQCRSIDPQLGILFLIELYELSVIVPLIQAGATGCIAYNESPGDLARAIIAVGRGELVMPPALATEVLIKLVQRTPIPHQSVEALSEREVEVLGLLAAGCTNKDLAQTLVLSVRTVETHLRSIYGKIGARSRTEAALWAIQHGYSSEHR